jgi:thiol-disulfide isomerase/thioredoxin
MPMNRLPRVLAAAVAVVVSAALLTGCSGRDAVSQGDSTNYRYIGTTPKGKTIAVADRKHAGEVSGPLLSGGDWNLAADKGKVVVLNFWASWCPPCRNESPGFEAMYRKYHASGVEVVGLDVKDPNLDSAKSFVRGFHLTYPIVRDDNAKTALELGKVPLTIGLPWTVVIDKQQRVAAVYNGEVLPADLEPALTQLTAES